MGECAQIGVVVIGRNEGERLEKCLRSSVRADVSVCYVDSGSSDGSVAFARSLGVGVVELPADEAFSAGRARNAGFRKLSLQSPNLAYVQFVDGDCEIVDGWLEIARKALDADDRLAVVAGRRRERFPQASRYNQLCDIEWDTPVGEARACGGDAMMRVSAFEASGGYNVAVIAGEEPELCVRLRREGWVIKRVDAEMTLHDAAMTRFSQWWRRAQRAGHAYAQGAWMHGLSPQRHCVKPVISILVWSVMLPAMLVSAAMLVHPIALAGCVLYPLQCWRISRKAGCRGVPAAFRMWYAFFIVIGKFAEMMGVLRFLLRKLTGRTPRIIEYKQATV